jgi:hypothetical protein
MIYMTKAVKHRRHQQVPAESVSAGLSPQGLWYTCTSTCVAIRICTPCQTPEEEDVASEEAAGSGEDDNEGKQSRCFRPPPL